MGRESSREKRAKAAILLGQARLSRSEVAEQVGVSKSTLYGWEQDPEFKQIVGREIDDFRREQRRIGLATVEQRVAHKRHRHNLINRLISERADDPAMADVPGGKTGLLVRRIRRVESFGVGQDDPRSVEVSEYEYDPAPLKELDTLERETAIDLGQWQTKVEVSAVDMRAAVANTQTAAETYTDPEDESDDE